MIHIRNEQDTQAYKISTRLLMLEALKKGYKITYFPSAPSTESGIARCEKNGKEFFFKSTCTALTPSYGVFAAENKVLTHSLLDANKVKTPAIHVLAYDDPVDAAMYMLRQYERVVVKPAEMNHGDGVTIGIRDEKSLAQAVDYARSCGGNMSDVIVQQQVEGKEYRFLVVSGKVIAVAHRRPPFVVGDGESSVEELIACKNSDPRRGTGHSSELTQISIEEVVRFKGAKLLQQVPRAGQEVQLLDTSNLSKGGESVDYTNIASSAIKKLAIEAARATYLGIAGVDIITADVEANTVSDSYIIEVNLTPGIRMHQFPTVGEPIDVAAKIFSQIEHTARPIGKHIELVGKSEAVTLPDYGANKIPARIDTGATLSSIWVSDIAEDAEGLSFTLFDKSSEYYTGERITVQDYSKRAVSSSMGETQIRYRIKATIILKGRKIRASITLADRSTQVYPILIGRNIIRNKFIVDVSVGTKSYAKKERQHRMRLNAITDNEGRSV